MEHHKRKSEHLHKKTLRKRVIAEWDYEKKLSQQYKVQTEFLDGYLKKMLK